MQTLFSILVLASSLTVIISVLLQEGEDGGGGLGAIAGGNTSDSLFGMNKGRSKQAILQRITAISAAIFIVSTLVLAAK